MTASYNKYYQTENLFGNPYPELIEFFANHPNKGTVLDLGCGQGRDALAIARLGFQVTGIDSSKVGIKQMNDIAHSQGLPLTGIVTNIYDYLHFNEFDFILLDSMFHFAKNDKKREIEFIKKITLEIKKDCLIIFCIQDTGKKIAILNNVIDSVQKLEILKDKKFEYAFEDNETGHKSKTDYRMIVVRKC